MADDWDRGSWLRHRGGAARHYSAKQGARWRLEDGTTLADGSGGTLLQSLTGLAPPPPQCFANVAPSSGFETPRQRDLARRIAARHLAPGYSQTWTASGSDGNELALWLLTRGRPEAGRPRFLIGQGGYHGATGLLRQLSTRLPSSPAPVFGEVERAVLPVFAGETAAARFDEAQAWFDTVGLGARDILILETVPTTGPAFAPDWTFLARIVALVQERGGQVLLDEVACGAYRHGWFSSLAEGLRPDAVVVGKGLTCGTVPCTAVIVGDAVVDRVRGSGEKIAGFTIALTDIAADLVGQTLDRYERLSADGWFERRGQACAALAEAARAAAPAAVRCEATATSLRWASADPAWFARLQASAAAHRLFLYTSACPIDGRQWHFALYCPAFDLPEAEIEALDRTMLAVSAEAGA